MNINLLWPRWAHVAAHVHYRVVQARGHRCWRIVHYAGALLANRYGREQDAYFARLAWEKRRAS